MERTDRCLSCHLIFCLVTSLNCFLTTSTICKITKEEFGSIINPQIKFVSRSHCGTDILRSDGKTYTMIHSVRRLTCQLTYSTRRLKSKGSCVPTDWPRLIWYMISDSISCIAQAAQVTWAAAKGDGKKDELGDTATERRCWPHRHLPNITPSRALRMPHALTITPAPARTGNASRLAGID